MIIHSSQSNSNSSILMVNSTYHYKLNACLVELIWLIIINLNIWAKVSFSPWRSTFLPWRHKISANHMSRSFCIGSYRPCNKNWVIWKNIIFKIEHFIKKLNIWRSNCIRKYMSANSLGWRWMIQVLKQLYLWWVRTALSFSKESWNLSGRSWLLL